MNTLSFIITTHKDLPKLERLATSLRTHYSTEIVSVLSDGDDDPKIKELCEKYNFQYFLYLNSYKLEHGFRFWRNVFEVFAKNPTDYFIKLDTDVEVKGRLPEDLTPYRFTMFGSLVRTRANINFVQNGIRGFSKEVLGAIQSSSYYQNDQHFADAFKAKRIFNATQRLERGLISTEFLMYEMSQLENLPIMSHPDILSYWLCPKTNGYYNEKGDLLTQEQFSERAKDAKFVHPSV